MGTKNNNIDWDNISTTGVCLTNPFSTNNTARMYIASISFSIRLFRPDSGSMEAIGGINSLGFNPLMEQLETLSWILYPLEVRRKHKLNKI